MTGRGGWAILVRMLHCWTDRAEHFETVFGVHSDEHLKAAYDEPSATCMREDGHDGSHEWTPDDAIGVSFAADTHSSAS